jgi:lysophospholipid acyltransferase (LPLAT)-like uncharacterized protein
MRVLHSTLRFRCLPRAAAARDRDPPSLRGPVLYAFWHQTQLIPAWTHRDRGIGILISRHGDGELIARVVDRLGFHPVRGSTTRGGVPALKALVRELRGGRDVAVTLDGPRGPRFRAQPGIVLLASMSGVPVLPTAFVVSRVKRLRSWDRFLVPRPFSDLVMRLGEPIHVPRDLDRDGREEYRLRIEQALRDLTARSWRAVRRPANGR